MRPENLDLAFVVVIAAPAKRLQWKKFPGFLKKEDKKIDVNPRILQLATRVVYQETLTGVDVVARTTGAGRVVIVVTAMMIVATAVVIVVTAVVIVVTAVVIVVTAVIVAEEETVVVAAIVVAVNFMPKNMNYFCSFNHTLIV
jgi:hypothetical protein